MKELISVVVPIYKAEYFFPRCIQSILNQSYFEIEIILVDDGSPDNCPKICDEYAAKDSRIHVIHQQNGGLCNARNIGLTVARGGVICFVDDDDWLPKNAIEKLYRKMEQTNADFVCGNYTIINKPFFNKKTAFWKDAVFNLDDKKAFEEFMPPYFTPWGKLYRKKIILDHSIRFDPEINVAEDEYFIFKYLQCCKKIATISDNVCYHNRLLDISEARRYHANYAFCHYIAEKERLKLFNGTNIPYKEQRFLIAVSVQSLLCYVHNLSEMEAMAKLKETKPYFVDMSQYITRDFYEDHKDEVFLQRYAKCYKLINDDDFLSLLNFLADIKSSDVGLKRKTARLFNKLVPLMRFFIFRLKWFYR